MQILEPPIGDIDVVVGCERELHNLLVRILVDSLVNLLLASLDLLHHLEQEGVTLHSLRRVAVVNYFVGKDDLLPDLFEGLLLDFGRLDLRLFLRGSIPAFLLLFGFGFFVNFEIFGAMRGNVIVLNRKLLAEESRVELEVHWEEILVRTEQFFPDFHGLQYLYLDTWIQILRHEQPRYFEEELLGGDLGVERKFAAEGEVLEEVEAEEENLFAFDAEPLRDCVDGVLGHVDSGVDDC